MGRREDITPESISASRLSWLKREMTKANKERALALGAGSYSAAAGFARQVLQLRNELDNEEIRLASLQKAKQREAGDYSAEEWASMVAADAASSTTEDLEVYMGEWLRRSKLQIEPGTLRLVRRTA